jgi:hypothetical protein
MINILTMRHYWPLLLLGIALSAHGQPQDPPEKTHLFAPWKTSKYRTYHNNPALRWERAGVFNDFWGIEGQRSTFSVEESLRYTPGETPGFRQKNEKSLNVLGVGRVPFSNHFALFAKAGPAYYQPIFHENPDPIYLSQNDMDTWGLSYSTGASFYLTPRVELSLEYMHTEVDQLEVDSGNAQLSWNY